MKLSKEALKKGKSDPENCQTETESELNSIFVNNFPGQPDTEMNLRVNSGPDWYESEVNKFQKAL